MKSTIEREGFSRRLRDSLTSNGLPEKSSTVLAREFNRRFPGQPVTGQAARKWLSGESIPEQSRLLVLAHWLGVSAEWLRYGGTEAPTYQTEEPTVAVDYELARNFARLSPPRQTIVRRLVKDLIAESAEEAAAGKAAEAALEIAVETAAEMPRESAGEVSEETAGDAMGNSAGQSEGEAAGN